MHKQLLSYLDTGGRTMTIKMVSVVTVLVRQVFKS